MTIATRTPEGSPLQCPICGKSARLEPCIPGGDSVCPSCGHLLLLTRDRIGKIFDVNADSVTFDTLLKQEAGFDSLGLVELVMELEEETRIQIPDEVAENLRSVRDVITYLRQRQGDP